MLSTALCHETPNETARRLIGRDYLSYSAISTFQMCPLKFRFRYVDGLAEESVSAGLVFGSAIHAVLEFHFRELQAGQQPPDLDTLLGVYHDHWNDQDLAAVRFGRREEVGSLAVTAERMIRAFQASDLAEPVGRILGVEEELREPVVADCPDLLARIDLLTETDDALIVTDFKTSSRRWTPGRPEADAEQLLLYSEIASRLVPEKPVRREFVVLTKGQATQVERFPIERDRRPMRSHQVIRAVWAAIKSGHFYPAPSPIACASCPFRVPCRHWNG